MQFTKRPEAFDLPSMVEGIFLNKAIPTRPFLKRASTVSDLLNISKRDSLSKITKDKPDAKKLSFWPLETLTEEVENEDLSSLRKTKRKETNVVSPNSLTFEDSSEETTEKLRLAAEPQKMKQETNKAANKNVLP